MVMKGNTGPVAGDKQIKRARQSLNTRAEIGNEVRNPAIFRGLTGHRVDNRKEVFGTMGELPHDELRVLLRALSRVDVDVFTPTHSRTSPFADISGTAFAAIHRQPVSAWQRRYSTEYISCVRTASSEAACVRDRSSGWMASSQRLPIHSSFLCPVNQRQLGEFPPRLRPSHCRSKRLALRFDERLEASFRMFELFRPLRDAHLKFVFRAFQGGESLAMGRDFEREAVIDDLQLAWTGNCDGFRNERENRDCGCDRNDCRDGLYVPWTS